LGERDFNVFEGFFNNWLFLAILLFTSGMQLFIVQFGGSAVTVAPLSLTEHLMCIGIGFTSLIIAFPIKLFLPVTWFDRLHMKEEPMTDEEESTAFTTQFRKSFR